MLNLICYLFIYKGTRTKKLRVERHEHEYKSAPLKQICSCSLLCSKLLVLKSTPRAERPRAERPLKWALGTKDICIHVTRGRLNTKSVTLMICECVGRYEYKTKARNVIQSGKIGFKLRICGLTVTMMLKN